MPVRAGRFLFATPMPKATGYVIESTLSDCPHCQTWTLRAVRTDSLARPTWSEFYCSVCGFTGPRCASDDEARQAWNQAWPTATPYIGKLA